MPDHPVVDGQGAVRVAGLEQVEGVVPGVVHVEEVAVLPVGRPFAHEPDAVGHTPGHFVGVHHRVDAPDVVAVALHRRLAELL